MKSEFFNRSLLQLAYTLGIAFLIEFLAETGSFLYVFLACVVLKASYFIFQAYLHAGEAKYAPMLEESESKAASKQAAYSKLEDDFNDYFDWSKKEISRQEEGIASLLRNAEQWQKEKEAFERKINDLQSGKELQDAQWEVTRLQEELSNLRVSFEREVNQAVDKLTKTESGYQDKILDLSSKVNVATGEVNRLKKDIEMLLSYKQKAEALQKEIDTPNAKRAFQQLIKTENLEALRAAIDKLIELGINPETLCDTAEKRAKYKEATQLQIA